MMGERDPQKQLWNYQVNLDKRVRSDMIRSWLGHASIETTNSYVEIDLEMKRKTLQSCEKFLTKKVRQGASWQRNNDILSWLSKL